MKKNLPRNVRRRRDATGHLDPNYAAELLAQSRENRTSDPPPSGFVSGERDDLAEELAEDFVRAATSAEDGDNDAGDELIKDELDLPEGDDDDLAFEPEELRVPRLRSQSTERKAARTGKAAGAKAKPLRASKAKAKPAKAKTGKAKAAKAKPAKAKTGTAKAAKTQPAKAKTGKAKAAKAKPAKAKTGTAKAVKTQPVKVKTAKAMASKTKPVKAKPTKALARTRKG